MDDYHRTVWPAPFGRAVVSQYGGYLAGTSVSSDLPGPVRMTTGQAAATPNLGPAVPGEQGEHRPLAGPVPIPISVRTRNLIVVAVITAILVLFWQVPTILVIVLGGGFLALILSFPVRLLSRLIPRGLAIFIATFSLFLGLLLLILGIVPVLIEQLTALIGAVPTVAADIEGLLRDAILPLQERGLLTADTDTVIASLRDGATARVNELTREALGGLVGAVTGTLDVAVTAFAIVFVAVYLLVDIRRIKLAALRSLPAMYRWDAEDLWDRFGNSLSRYLAGLATSLAAQGILTWLALAALGVPYAFLLGFWVSLTAIIPYLGAFLGAIPAVILAFIVSPTTGFLTLGLYILIQQLESNFLTPRIQGQAVRVHPIIVLLAVIAANQLFGLVGAVFAVPALAVIRVLIDFLVVRLRVQR